MISELKSPTDMTFYIAHNNKDVFHYGVLWKGLFLATGQPFFEQFKAEEEYLARLQVLVKGVVGTEAFSKDHTDNKAYATAVKNATDKRPKDQ